MISPAIGEPTQYHDKLHSELMILWGIVRLRAAKDRLKVEHSIIGGLRQVLEELLEQTPEIASIIPGEIRKVRKARGPVTIRVTIPTRTGWKAIALASGARQELFVNTRLEKEQLEQALSRALGDRD